MKITSHLLNLNNNKLKVYPKMQAIKATKILIIIKKIYKKNLLQLEKISQLKKKVL